ncbi:molecular chaperone DnaJ [Pseudolabrys sp. Root1462]|uniref:DnaJ domain-containing protein n=1 Tax=Pseudolabrys sp. Root1462 TaxID=1736466 RepID=UPI0007024D23|nr:DnaJ domain-containing protein [Pseudolabrys sp. Root1462]KQZ00664.1 molecular chaperone DnaJ [Pseudolabrys sp. Root1462]
MPTLIFGVLILVAAIWVVGVISRIDPKVGARVLKAGGGIIAIGLAAFLGLRGELYVAIPLGMFGLGLLGWLPFGPAGFSSRTRKSGGQVSRVRTAFVEMTLDHDSGAMRGQVLAGQFVGRALDDLDIDALIALLREADDETRSLLVPYLDRRDAGWREHAQGDAAAGRAAPGSAKMTEEEAYQILGLQRGASERDITRAHRALMKKFHPDQGGSTYLAARINEAKEKLLRQHR